MSVKAAPTITAPRKIRKMDKAPQLTPMIKVREKRREEREKEK